MNDISCCSLIPEARERLATTADDTLSIVVKFAPKEMLIQLSRLEFVANNTTLSSLGLAPKLLYVDEKCIINEFIQVELSPTLFFCQFETGYLNALLFFGELQSRNSNYEDDIEPEMIEQTARLLAGIHSAKPAISGNGFNAWRQVFLQDAAGHLPPLYQAIQEKRHLKSLEKESSELKEKYCKS